MTAHLHITGPAASELKKLAKKNRRSTASEGQFAIEWYLTHAKRQQRIADEKWAERKP